MSVRCRVTPDIEHPNHGFAGSHQPKRLNAIILRFSERLRSLAIEVPKKAQYIRVPLDELQRISSHLLWLATAAIDLGAITPFFYTFREREVILDLFEDYCGARLTLNRMRIGGLLEDLPPGWVERLRAFTEVFDRNIDEYEDLLTENRIWKMRTIGIGILNGTDIANPTSNAIYARIGFRAENDDWHFDFVPG